MFSVWFIFIEMAFFLKDSSSPKPFYYFIESFIVNVFIESTDFTYRKYDTSACSLFKEIKHSLNI